jgi:hypothetical protein
MVVAWGCATQNDESAGYFGAAAGLDDVRFSTVLAIRAGGKYDAANLASR